MATKVDPAGYDYVIIGSGFGGSVSAMRLAEKGYSVLVLERGKRFQDPDFPRTNWNIFKYLWLPALRCFGIMQLTLFKDMLVLHGSGVGGGSLGYANVLMKPSDVMFANPAWSHLADWKQVLEPYYAIARRMLGVAPNPNLYPSDAVLREIAAEMGTEFSFHPTQVGVYFGEAGKEGESVPDPYFDGQGPERRSCTYCGGCMIGCRENAKNTLPKNYLYFAEKWGAQVQAESEVDGVHPLPEGQPDGMRYLVTYHRSTAWPFKPEMSVRARNVIFAAGALGTLKLLFHCQSSSGMLPELSPRLGERVLTNSESLYGSTARGNGTDYSQGIAITSIFNPDPVTSIEPVRYPAGSDLMRLLSGPMVDPDGGVLARVGRSLRQLINHPGDFLRTYIFPGWAKHSTIFLVMQTMDNNLRMRWGRSGLTFFRRGLISEPDPEHRVPSSIPAGRQVTHRFASLTDGIPLSSVNEGLLNIPLTAHILGGVPMGRDAGEGVVGLDTQIHNYPGLYVIDGSIMPANPGINPSLTIAALAEYAMSIIPPRLGSLQPQPLGKDFESISLTS